jgi:hypothetical protein
MLTSRTATGGLEEGLMKSRIRVLSTPKEPNRMRAKEEKNNAHHAVDLRQKMSAPTTR